MAYAVRAACDRAGGGPCHREVRFRGCSDPAGSRGSLVWYRASPGPQASRPDAACALGVRVLVAGPGSSEAAASTSHFPAEAAASHRAEFQALRWAEWHLKVAVPAASRGRAARLTVHAGRPIPALRPDAHAQRRDRGRARDALRPEAVHARRCNPCRANPVQRAPQGQRPSSSCEDYRARADASLLSRTTSTSRRVLLDE